MIPHESLPLTSHSLKRSQGVCQNHVPRYYYFCWIYLGSPIVDKETSRPLMHWRGQSSQLLSLVALTDFFTNHY